MAGPRSQSPPEQSPTQPSGPPSQPPSEAHAAFFLTRPDNTTRRLNAATPSLDDNSPSILDQRRQLAELLKHFPYQAPTGIRSNTPISPLCLSKNPSSNGSARETDADTDPSFYPSPVNSQTLHHPLEIDIFTHKDAEKLVAWIDKKKNPLSARAVAQRYQVYLNQELSDAGSSPLGGLSASGPAPGTCSNDDKTVLEDPRLDQLYWNSIFERNKPSEEEEKEQLYSDHSLDDSQEQTMDSETTHSDQTQVTARNNLPLLPSLGNPIPSVERGTPQYNKTRYNGMTLNDSFITPADHDHLQRLGVKTRRWKRLASSTPSAPFPATLPCSDVTHDGVDELGYQTDIFNLIPADTLVIKHREEEFQAMADRLERAIAKLPARTENVAVFPFATRFGCVEWTKASDPHYLYPYEKPFEVCLFVKSDPDSSATANTNANTTTSTSMNTTDMDSQHDDPNRGVKYNLNPSENSNPNANQPEQGRGRYIRTSMERVGTAIMARRPIPKTIMEAILMLNVTIFFYSTWYGLDPHGVPHKVRTDKDRVRKVVLETLVETLYHEAYEG
ncbi:hypothetical protein C343_06724 [Cryptococcus neoformans C23]|uniref:Uncharacterized protein n=1 Tax=Cryptococcus neoformans (strain H99 / ATCC 208821 / CBS 10515 / FGSC 9487) TaxID=235443 RepID=J9W172_CRYN9|nr:hypothetical protein CNAG_06509 [Cryptococcus neoformans var. grubii H99]AFR98739.1 hypothetical protein CNAG_06509 [Cryptococcus neoformans var. grubii H99]AUB28925.1 hypothetical protein CKF44_06509 [Cryptococcus neoformans var. grubii]OWZ38548.1 hypothetical protein C343_06724 [Cryptococcus neoformans var. grubii C23]|eukprot:XP_012053534.1 hypothetical protein CNAG_06509 [Cryptococcus neoformans var. grubii H99]